MKKIGIMADIHGNLAALDAAFDVFKKENVDRIYACGDIVGYGNEPEACCRKVQSIGAVCVAGNHDWAAAGKLDYAAQFSESAVKSMHETIKKMSPENIKWLGKLSLYHRQNNFEFTHASLYRPDQWPYLVIGSPDEESVFQDIALCFDHMKGSVCFVGHSHRAAVFIKDASKEIYAMEPYEFWVNLAGKKAVIDVGSVGKPRDNVFSGCVAVFDIEKQRVKMVRFPF